MQFPVWALRKVSMGEVAVVSVQGWGTKLVPMEVRVIDSWGGRTNHAVYFSTGDKFFMYKFSIKEGVYSDANWDNFRLVECPEVRRREKVVWEYEAVEPVNLPARHLN